MSAQVCQETKIYHCLYCGPCMQMIDCDGSIIIHQDVPHPVDAVFHDDDDQDLKQ